MAKMDNRTVGDILTDLDAAPLIGDNGAPPELTPFQEIEKEILDLYEEARGWLDGDPIATQGQAEDLGKLRDKIRDAGNRAEVLRKAEAKPFDDGKAEVQARFNPLVQKDRGKCDIAVQTCNRALAPWLKKLDDEQRERARLAQIDAERIANLAREAAREAAKTGNLDQREAAEDLLAEAKTIAKTTRALEKEKPQVAGLNRAIGMKTVYTAELTDPAAAIAHYRTYRPAELKEWLREQARLDIKAGPKPPAPIPGFKINDERVPA